MIINYLIRQQM